MDIMSLFMITIGVRKVRWLLSSYYDDIESEATVRMSSLTSTRRLCLSLRRFAVLDASAVNRFDLTEESNEESSL